MRVFAMVVVAAACGGAKENTKLAAPDPIPHTAGPDCTVVADRLVTVALTDHPDAQARARDQLHARCTTDNWSDESRNCFAGVENDQEIDGCKAMLSASQRDALAVLGGEPAAAPKPQPTPPPQTTPKRAPSDPKSSEATK